MLEAFSTTYPSDTILMQGCFQQRRQTLQPSDVDSGVADFGTDTWLAEEPYSPLVAGST